MYDTLIDKLIDIRKQCGYSQSRLARDTDIKQQVLSRIERRQQSVSLLMFIQLLNTLGYRLEIVRKE